MTGSILLTISNENLTIVYKLKFLHLGVSAYEIYSRSSGSDVPQFSFLLLRCSTYLKHKKKMLNGFSALVNCIKERERTEFR